MSSKLLSLFSVCVSLVFVHSFCVCSCEEEVVFSNSWAVEVKGGSYLADQLAEKHGFINKGLVRMKHGLHLDHTCNKCYGLIGLISA